MKQFASHSLEDTGSIAAEILNALGSRTSDQNTIKEATIVGLSGHLGAGKTAFVKAAARILGIKEEITSPTFVIMKAYPLTHPIWKKLVHIDAYRLEHGRELVALNFEKLAADPSNLIFIEWPENVEEALSGTNFYSTVTFSIPSADEHERNIIFAKGPITTA